MEEQYQVEQEQLENISESHDSQLIPQQQVYMQENIDEIIRKQPIFFEQEIQSGNFNLLLLHMPEDLNELDNSGYSIMHHAISYGRIDIVKYFLQRGANPNVKSSLQQSCLMMVSNFGIKELVQIFIDLGNKIEEVDNKQYTALLYAVKSKQQLIALYLISLGANTNIKDDQGCSIIHWAAYNNDVYLLKYFEENQNYNAIDSQGKTPLIRAISNYSNDAVKYLLQRYPNLLPNQNVDLKTVSIQKIVEDLRFNFRLKSINFKYILFTLISIFYIIEGYIQVNNFIRIKNEDSFGYNLLLVNLIFNLYTLFYTIIFFWKTTNKQDQGQKISQKLGHPKISYTCNHSHNGDQHHMLVEDQKIDDQFEDYEQNKDEQTSELLRAVKLYFEKDEQYQNFDLLMTCPICEIIRKEQVYHCDECNTCVKGFHFHSIILNKCINNTNHFFYFLLLFTYQIHLQLIIYSTYYTIHQEEQNIGMIFFQPFFSDINLIEFIGYYILLICLYFIFINLIFQIFCIFSNLTQHEMLQKHQYKYLYQIVKIKTFYFMNVKNCGDIFENVKNYIWNQYNELRLL